MVCESIRLSSVVDLSPEEEAPPEIAHALIESKIDYVIGTANTREPLFSIIFVDPAVTLGVASAPKEDAVNSCFMESGIELLRIGTEFLENYERASLLEWVVQRFLAWQEHSEKYYHEYGYDLADIIFNHRFHFPAVRKVAERLFEKEIHTTSFSGGLPDREESQDITPRYFCRTYGESEYSKEPYGNRTVEITVGLFRVRDPVKSPFDLSNLQELTRSTHSVTVTAFGDAGKIPAKQQPFVANYAFFYGLAGADMVTIAKGLTTYLCLKEIEKWIGQHGVSSNGG